MTKLAAGQARLGWMTQCECESVKRHGPTLLRCEWVHMHVLDRTTRWISEQLELSIPLERRRSAARDTLAARNRGLRPAGTQSQAELAAVTRETEVDLEG